MIMVHIWWKRHIPTVDGESPGIFDKPIVNFFGGGDFNYQPLL